MDNLQIVIDRVRKEFVNMGPEQGLSVEQVEGLCGGDTSTTETVLEFLVDAEFLGRASTYFLKRA